MVSDNVSTYEGVVEKFRRKLKKKLVLTIFELAL